MELQNGRFHILGGIRGPLVLSVGSELLRVSRPWRSNSSAFDFCAHVIHVFRVHRKTRSRIKWLALPGRTQHKMMGIVKKVNAQGFGIIDGADGSKVPFILSQAGNHSPLKKGQKVVYSVRIVNDKAFAQNVVLMRRPPKTISYFKSSKLRPYRN